MGTNALRGRTTPQRAAWEMVSSGPTTGFFLYLHLKNKPAAALTPHPSIPPSLPPSSQQGPGGCLPSVSLPQRSPPRSQLLPGPLEAVMAEGRHARNPAHLSLPAFAFLTAAMGDAGEKALSLYRLCFPCTMPKPLVCKQNLRKGLICNKAPL